MYRIAEIANDLGVSKQTVYNHIEKLDKELEGNIYKRKGATVIDIEGVKLLQESINGEDSSGIGFENVERGMENGDSENVKNPYNKEVIDLLKEQIETLKDQLDKKDELIKEQTELIRNSQVLIQQNQDRIEEIEGEVQEQKMSFWKKLKWW